MSKVIESSIEYLVVDSNKSNTVVVTEDSKTTTNTQIHNVVVDQPQVSVIVSAGSQGPQGIQGESYTYVNVISAQVLAGHRVVTINNSGELIYADNSIEAHADKIVGIVTNSYSTGESAQVQIVGQITEPSWNWTLDTPIYISTNGLLTQTPPISGFSYIIGFPVTNTKMFINKNPGIILS